MPPERLADRLLRTCDGVCPVSNLSELTDFVGQRQAEPAVAFSRFLLAVKIYFPNSGHLQNFGGFARRQDMSDTGQLEFSMDPRYVSVHPIALSMAAAAGQLALSNGGQVTVDLNAKGDSIRYLTRMRLMAALGQDPAVTMTEHAPEGRFIPVTTVQDQQDLNGFIVDMVPLLHASPEEVGPIKYVITELVRNVLEHAGSPVGALVSAQYFAQTSRLSLGVADLGVGIRASIAQSHNPQSDLDAIHLALRPGVTGTTARVGGNEQNAGAGLFFTKSIALTTRNFLVVYSGSAAFKLLKVPEKGQATLLSDPSADRATSRNGSAELARYRDRGRHQRRKRPGIRRAVVRNSCCLLPRYTLSQEGEISKAELLMIELTLLDEVGEFAGDKDVAAALRTGTLEPAMLAGTSVVLDFEGVELATQSFIHALISELVRSDQFDALSLIEFQHCNESIRELIEIVAEYSQEEVAEEPDEAVS